MPADMYDMFGSSWHEKVFLQSIFSRISFTRIKYDNHNSLFFSLLAHNAFLCSDMLHQRAKTQ